MIILNKFHGADYTTDDLIIADDLYSDTKEELESADISDPEDITGLPEGYSLTTDSKAHTPDGDIAILDSQGTWHWVGEDNDTPVGTLSLSRPSLLNTNLNTQEVEPSIEEFEPLVGEEE